METMQLYTDDFMLSRLIASINKKDVEIRVVEPIIEKKNRKTFFCNFRDFCNSLRRDEQHLISYFDSELGEDMSVTEVGMLIINKTFEPKRIITILEQYINTYVKCKSLKCGSLSTSFQKEHKINYLVCEKCNSKYAISLKMSNI